MELERLPQALTVCKLASLPEADLSGDIFFLGRTENEISLVCETENVPAHTLAREDGWRGFRVRGELEFSLVGILAKLSGILAEHGISIFAVSTYDTDYLLVKADQFRRAADALRSGGYAVL